MAGVTGSDEESLLLRAGGPARLRVMSYNIRAGLGAESPWENLHLNRLDLEPVAEVIAAEAPDLVALQEIVVLEIGGRVADEAAFLAEQLGMYYSFGLVRDFPVIQQGKHVGNGLWGNAVLSRFPITSTSTYALSNIEGCEPRSLLEARVDCAGRLLSFFSAHLSFRPVETVCQAREVAACALPAMAAGDVILAGDFNCRAGSEPFAVLRASFQDSFSLWGAPLEDPCRHSFPYGHQRIKDLDHVFLSPRLSVAGSWVRVDETGASDHNPVVTDVSFH